MISKTIPLGMLLAMASAAGSPTETYCDRNGHDFKPITRGNTSALFFCHQCGESKEVQKPVDGTMFQSALFPQASSEGISVPTQVDNGKEKDKESESTSKGWFF